MCLIVRNDRNQGFVYHIRGEGLKHLEWPSLVMKNFLYLGLPLLQVRLDALEKLLGDSSACAPVAQAFCLRVELNPDITILYFLHRYPTEKPALVNEMPL